MARRARLTARKPKSKAKDAFKDATDPDGEPTPIPPDETRWRRMNPYGLFAISDKDGTKHRFKRGETATILPQDKTPGDPIEPHEYWVGKILEIRADAGTEDSDVIWTKVQWFYSAQDAAGVLGKSLDTSALGKFERIWSDHWDYVLPQAFNEVIPMPRLHTFPKPKSRPKLNLNLKFNKSRPASTSTTTTSTGTKVEDPEVDSPRLENQIPIDPETFYWRYTLEVQERKINPKPNSRICLCSSPYHPDDTSLLSGVMLFCPRPSCKTGYHIGCLKDAKSVWVDSEVVVPSPVKGKSTRNAKGISKDMGQDIDNGQTRGKGRGRGRERGRGRKKGGARGKAKQREPEMEMDEDISDEYDGFNWIPIPPRALRLLTTSPDTNAPVDFFHLIRSGSGTPEVTIRLLQRVHERQLAALRKATRAPNGKDESPSMRRGATSGISASMSAKSKISGGSLVEVEDLLVEDEWNDDDDSMNTNARTRKQPNRRTSTCKSIPHSRNTTAQTQSSKPKPKPPPAPPLTPIKLLTTLFLLPSLFPPSRSKNTTTTPHSNSASPQNQNQNQSQTTNLTTLLHLASQPLLRGGAYFPYLGPTGNINTVLAARQLIRDAFQVLGELTLTSPEGEEDVDNNNNNNNNNTLEEKDSEDFRKAIACIEEQLGDWREKVIGEVEGKVVPPGGEVEDAVVVGFDGWKIWVGDDGDGGVVGDGENVDVDMVDGRTVVLGQKRRQRSARWRTRATVKDDVDPDVDVEDMLLRVDWACPGCGGSI